MLELKFFLGLIITLTLVWVIRLKLKLFEMQDENQELNMKANSLRLKLKKETSNNNKRAELIYKKEQAILNFSKFLKNGVFYDRENDTIVIAENLERIGEFE